jgi:hypothetical protein
VLKTLLCAMMKKIEQLEEVQKNRDSVGHQCPIRPLTAHKLAAAATHPALRPEVNFVSLQMETLRRILNSNGAYGPPPNSNSLSTIAG